jgi:hypothetical protein
VRGVGLSSDSKRVVLSVLFKKRIGQHGARSSDPNDLTVGSSAYAGRPIDLDKTLLVRRNKFEPVRDIDKQAVERSPKSRENFTRDTALTAKSGRLACPQFNAEHKFRNGQIVAPEFRQRLNRTPLRSS